MSEYTEKYIYELKFAVKKIIEMQFPTFIGQIDIDGLIMHFLQPNFNYEELTHSSIEYGIYVIFYAIKSRFDNPEPIKEKITCIMDILGIKYNWLQIQDPNNSDEEQYKNAIKSLFGGLRYNQIIGMCPDSINADFRMIEEGICTSGLSDTEKVIIFYLIQKWKILRVIKDVEDGVISKNRVDFSIDYTYAIVYFDGDNGAIDFIYIITIGNLEVKKVKKIPELHSTDIHWYDRLEGYLSTYYQA